MSKETAFTAKCVQQGQVLESNLNSGDPGIRYSLPMPKKRGTFQVYSTAYLIIFIDPLSCGNTMRFPVDIYNLSRFTGPQSTQINATFANFANFAGVSRLTKVSYLNDKDDFRRQIVVFVKSSAPFVFPFFSLSCLSSCLSGQKGIFQC